MKKLEPLTPSGENLINLMFSRQPSKLNQIIHNKVIGIIGAGGLGSHVAYIMAKSGVKKIIISDFDTVSASNIARQYYFLDQVGIPKVMALEYMLRFILPQLEFEGHEERVTNENIKEIFKETDIIFECVDDAQTKSLLFEQAKTSMSHVPWVFASGIGGIHSGNEIKARKISKNIAIVGDEIHDDQEGVTISRVLLAASIQALTGIRLLMGEEP